MNNNLKNIDLKFGLNSEKIILEIIKKKFNNNIIQTNKYDIFDFYDDENKIYFELKTRKCSKNQYLDSMIGLNKINYASKNHSDYTFYFIFAFDDDILYWKYDENIQLNYRSGGRNDRNKNEYKDYAYIPINLMSKL